MCDVHILTEIFVFGLLTYFSLYLSLSVKMSCVCGGTQLINALCISRQDGVRDFGQLKYFVWQMVNENVCYDIYDKYVNM